MSDSIFMIYQCN